MNENIYVPHDIESEKCLLGSILMDKTAINKVVTIVDKDDFYLDNHKRIYNVLEELYNKGDDIDVVVVNSLLKEFKWYQKLDGISYLIGLMELIPTSGHCITYANTIRKNKVLRDLIDAGQTITSMGCSVAEEAPEVSVLIEEAQKKIFNINDKGVTKEFVNVEDCIQENINRIKNPDLEKSKGVLTGFNKLDDVLNGLHKSNLVILAARPAQGKSSMAMDITRHASLNCGKSVAFFSLEMSKDELIDRLISSEAKVNSWKMRTGLIEKGTQEAMDITEVGNKVRNSKLFINDTPNITVLQMRAMARKLKAKSGLDLIVVDYLQLIQPSNPKANDVSQMTEISRQLKIMAKELNVPVLALSQLSRAVESRIPAIPRLSDLRTSGSIEQDADVVMFIYREELYKPDTPNVGLADIIIAKHRSGAVGKVRLAFKKEYTSFENFYDYN